MARRTTRTTTSFLRRNPRRSFSLSATPNVANHHTYTFDHYKTHSLELCKRLANLGGCESELPYFIDLDMLNLDSTLLFRQGH